MKTIAAGFGILFNNSATPEQARRAVARLRVWRRILVWTLVTLVPAGLAATVLLDRFSDFGPLPLFVVGAITVLFLMTYDAERRHLALSFTDTPLPDAELSRLTWRHGSGGRIARTYAVSAVVCGYLALLWIRHRLLVFDIPITIMYAWILYDGLARSAWRPFSRATHVADIDATGLYIVPLDLTVRWDQISDIVLLPDGVQWVLADQDGFIAALPHQGGRRRAIGRWIKTGKGIQIDNWRMREAPATVHATSLRLWSDAAEPGAAPDAGAK